MDFLFVRWFGCDAGARGGWKQKKLDLVGFLESDLKPFGFINPADVIRGVHLIPAFHLGRTGELLPGPSCYKDDINGKEWAWYYVNRFVFITILLVIGLLMLS